MCKHKDNKPLITILMAVYNPRMDWLKEQLHSLNMQTYPNLRLHIRDDCSTSVSFTSINELVTQCITSFPFTIVQNETNIGSNRTFEQLTAEADGDYFAYCDQDDIWMPDKLAILQNTIEKEKALLVCSDMNIIDSKGNIIADSITKVRRHHVFLTGEHLAPQMLTKNFVTGCTMLIGDETAKEAIPFCPYMVHDHYLAFFAALRGKIISIPEKLVKYRIHDHNQTPVMAGVFSKETYLHRRIELLISRLVWLQSRFSNYQDVSSTIRDSLIWAKARRDLFRGIPGARKTVMRYRYLGPSVSLFEIVMSSLPERMFMLFIRMAQNNKI